MTRVQRTNWDRLMQKFASGWFTRKQAREIIPEEEVNRLIDLGVILELGDHLQWRDGASLAS